MENASFHSANIIMNYLSSLRIEILFNPPYSPEMNAIELLFADLKYFIRKQCTINK